ncbi:hypothetical protein F0562_035995 [Nyssa sinensis]|uniref:Uncharacterized protein n=1 Tax=Nyssa sinensis TaxID=561372 RepID=A0A5J5ADC7_9ASTE|nr:hypothetical protein F0562_035995 [Nyssa sinensis]
MHSMFVFIDLEIFRSIVVASLAGHSDRSKWTYNWIDLWRYCNIIFSSGFVVLTVCRRYHSLVGSRQKIL